MDDQSELRFDLSPGPGAPSAARSRLNEVLGVDSAVLDRVKTIVSALITRSMREEGGAPIGVTVSNRAGALRGRVTTPGGWESLGAAARDGRRGLTVLDGMAGTWGVEGLSVWFVVA
jgi:hypothetical protein